MSITELGGLLAFALIVYVIVNALVPKRSALDRAADQVAPLLQGRYFAGGPFGEPWIETTVGGRPARILFAKGGRFEAPYSRVEVDVRGISPGWLHVMPSGMGRVFLQDRGGRDLTIGDPIFDHRYLVAATPESLAARVFRSEQRARVIASVLNLQDLNQPRIDLDQSYLTVQVTGLVTDERRLLMLVKTAGEFLTCVFSTPATEGVQIGEVRVETAGRCPVCGTGMSGEVVRCETCRTPHHAECWKYMGRCSTYACKGRRSVA